MRGKRAHLSMPLPVFSAPGASSMSTGTKSDGSGSESGQNPATSQHFSKSSAFERVSNVFVLSGLRRVSELFVAVLAVSG